MASYATVSHIESSLLRPKFPTRHMMSRKIESRSVSLLIIDLVKESYLFKICSASRRSIKRKLTGKANTPTHKSSGRAESSLVTTQSKESPSRSTILSVWLFLPLAVVVLRTLSQQSWALSSPSTARSM